MLSKQGQSTEGSTRNCGLCLTAGEDRIEKARGDLGSGDKYAGEHGV